MTKRDFTHEDWEILTYRCNGISNLRNSLVLSPFRKIKVVGSPLEPLMFPSMGLWPINNISYEFCLLTLFLITIRKWLKHGKHSIHCYNSENIVSEDIIGIIVIFRIHSCFRFWVLFCEVVNIAPHMLQKTMSRKDTSMSIRAGFP